jgi:hypothetical protein
VSLSPSSRHFNPRQRRVVYITSARYALENSINRLSFVISSGSPQKYPGDCLLPGKALLSLGHTRRVANSTSPSTASWPEYDGELRPRKAWTTKKRTCTPDRQAPQDRHGLLVLQHQSPHQRHPSHLTKRIAPQLAPRAAAPPAKPTERSRPLATLRSRSLLDQGNGVVSPIVMAHLSQTKLRLRMSVNSRRL